MILIKIQLVCQAIQGIFKGHLDAMFNSYDPIKQVLPESPLFNRKRNSCGSKKLPNPHYLFSFLYFGPIVADSVHVFYRNHFHYSGKTMPELFTHKVYPTEFWFMGDMIILVVGIPIALLTYASLMFDPMLDDKCRMVCVLNANPKSVKIIANGKGNCVIEFHFFNKKK